jgi:hypothetical protein
MFGNQFIRDQKKNRHIVYFEKCEIIDKKGYLVRYFCDKCGSLSKTTSSSLLNKNHSLNTIERQTCRSCRTRISEYDIKKTQIDFSKVKESITSQNYELLTSENEYIGSNNKSQMKLKVVCNSKHHYTTNWNNWNKGKRCRTCYEDNKRKEAIKYKFGYELYHYLVMKSTNKNYKINKNLLNPLGLKRSKIIHLDHVYSIYEGFQNNVPVYIISSVENLRLLDSTKNITKGKKSEITLTELCDKIFNT